MPESLVRRIENFLSSPCTILGWEASSWKVWLADLLITLHREAESFSGKRPNCNSGWAWALAEAMAQFIDPNIVISYDSAGCVDEVDWALERERFRQIVAHIFHNCCQASERR